MSSVPSNSGIASCGEVDIWYESFGDETQPAILLLSSLGGQALNWEQDFCELLAQKGFRVIRFDLRDCGLSTKLLNAPAPDMNAIIKGDFSSITYSFSDMAQDVIGLLNSLEIEAAHVVGVSLGGMIGQTLAIEHPQAVASLTSISSAPFYSSETGKVLSNSKRSTDDRQIALDLWMENRRQLASPAFVFDEAATRLRLEEMFDRCWYPVGRLRQLVAAVVSGDRTEALATVSVPVLVIHGDSDPLIDVSDGEATAKAIPGAELMIIEGMGHDLPRELWPVFAEAIASNAAKAR